MPFFSRLFSHVFLVDGVNYSECAAKLQNCVCMIPWKSSRPLKEDSPRKIVYPGIVDEINPYQVLMLVMVKILIRLTGLTHPKWFAGVLPVLLLMLLMFLVCENKKSLASCNPKARRKKQLWQTPDSQTPRSVFGSYFKDVWLGVLWGGLPIQSTLQNTPNKLQPAPPWKWKVLGKMSVVSRGFCIDTLSLVP